MVLTLRLLFHPPQRQAEGVSYLLHLMISNLPTPDHSTLSRGARTLNIRIKRRKVNNPLHLIVDSTGLSIHGEGPWSTGKKRRLGWRKPHIMMDREGFIHSICVSNRYTRDRSLVPVSQLDVIFSIVSLRWGDVSPQLFFENGIVGKIHSGNSLCNKAVYFREK